ncbi:unnamed protein product [Ascophyllum nodosum]
MLYRLLAAGLVVAGTGILIAGVGNIYAGTDLPLFVKIENVPEEEVITSDTFTRSVRWFESKGVRCHAWLYLPVTVVDDTIGNAKPPPVVIMGHGFGGQKDMGLAKYAEAFAKRGIASFVIDYRTFGGSDGMPRNLVSPWRHVEDYQAALDYIRGHSLAGQVDPTRVALWGTSFAGGHVLKVAAADENSRIPDAESIRAVISQTPHLDGRAASKRAIKQRGTMGTLKMAAATLGDGLRGLLGMQARYVSVVGCEGDGKVALMTLSQEGCDRYFQKHPSVYLGGWRNQACARVGAMVGLYSPIKALPEVKAPILFVGAEKDELCPADTVREAAKLVPDAKLSIHNVTHFDIYLGDALQIILKDMGDFLEEHFKP